MFEHLHEAEEPSTAQSSRVTKPQARQKRTLPSSEKPGDFLNMMLPGSSGCSHVGATEVSKDSTEPEADKDSNSTNVYNAAAQ